MTELKAGRELDALVAEKIFGYKPILRDDGTVSVLFERDDCPRYSTDIASAWEVVEKLIAGGRQVEVNGYKDEGDPSVDPWVVLVDLTVSHAPTAPLAICLAALKAVGQ